MEPGARSTKDARLRHGVGWPHARRRAGAWRGVLLALSAAASACASGVNIPTDARRFDPVRDLEAIRQLVGEDYGLQGFDAEGVRPDGTIDLTDERVGGSVTYRLTREAAPPADPPPIGAGGSVDGRWHQRALVSVERPGSHLVSNIDGTSQTRVSRGVLSLALEPEPGPAPPTTREALCHASALFAEAIARGAPREKVVATVYFYVNPDDPRDQSYVLEIPGTDLRWVFDRQCRAR